VLEGNFIYWMTGAYISVRSDEARAKIMDNLREEVRDCHPRMMRRFAIAAHANSDRCGCAGRLSQPDERSLVHRTTVGVPIVVTMAFFEGFIQRFMSYLAELAQRQGSAEMEYTDVHGVCDVTPYSKNSSGPGSGDDARAPLPEKEMFEGVELLRTLLQSIVVNTHSMNTRRGSHVSQGNSDFRDSADRSGRQEESPSSDR